MAGQCPPWWFTKSFRVCCPSGEPFGCTKYVRCPDSHRIELTLNDEEAVIELLPISRNTLGMTVVPRVAPPRSIWKAIYNIRITDSGGERIIINILRSPRNNLRFDGLKIITGTVLASTTEHGLKRLNTINIQGDGVRSTINDVNALDQN